MISDFSICLPISKLKILPSFNNLLFSKFSFELSIIFNCIFPSIVLIALAIDEPINPTPIIVINFIKSFSPKFL